MAKIYRFPSAQAVAERRSGANVAGAGSQPGLPVRRKWYWNPAKAWGNFLSLVGTLAIVIWLLAIGAWLGYMLLLPWFS